MNLYYIAGQTCGWFDQPRDCRCPAGSPQAKEWLRCWDDGKPTPEKPKKKKKV